VRTSVRYGAGPTFHRHLHLLARGARLQLLLSRSSNNGLLWRPDHVTAPTAYGWTIYTLVLLAALMAIFGQARLRKGSVSEWQVAVWVGVAASLLALFLQVWEFTAVPFYPGSSGYASTFIGYSVINILTIFIVLYWLETTVARSLRMNKEIGGVAPQLRCTLRRSRFARTWRQ